MILRLVLLTLVLGSGLLSGASYRFSLGGREFDPHILPVLGSRKGDYKPGDIGRVGKFPFILRSPGHYQFHIGGDDDSRLFCRIDEGPSHCVGVHVTESRDPTDDISSVVNPLAEMAPRERSRLWGIRVDVEPLAWDCILQSTGLDWNKTALRMDYAYNGKEKRVLPALPPNLRYLSLHCEGVTGLHQLHSLRKSKSLHFLDLHLYDQTVDLNSLGNNPGLVNLSISGGSLLNPNALSALSALRFLKLRRVDNLDSVAFVTSMPQLRVFKIDSTTVTDLRPLSSCPQLRLLSASNTPVEHLPDGTRLPNLKDVRILDTPTMARGKTAETLRRSVPGCTVHTTWEGALQSKLAGSDLLRVRSSGQGQGEDVKGPALLEIRNTDKIENLLRHITINRERSGYLRMCTSEFHLDFYRNGKLIASLGFHQGQCLRWQGGLWNGDAEISIPSARILCNLMATEGHHGPQKKLQAAIAGERARVKNWEPSIRAFEEADRTETPPENSILLTGSSSIRKWNLPESFPDQPMINRGFGGSELSDAIRYFDRIVLPYRPRIIFLYAGDNDIQRGKTAKQVVADYQVFARRVHRERPSTQFAFIAIKPSIKRWHLWPEMRLANEMIQELCQENGNLHYIDIADPMLGPEGTPIRELFARDGLHLSPAGYRVWAREISTWLKEQNSRP